MRTWEEYIRANIKEIGVNARNSVYQVQDRDYWKVLMHATVNLRSKTEESICQPVYEWIVFNRKTPNRYWVSGPNRALNLLLCKLYLILDWPRPHILFSTYFPMVD